MGNCEERESAQCRTKTCNIHLVACPCIPKNRLLAVLPTASARAMVPSRAIRQAVDMGVPAPLNVSKMRAESVGNRGEHAAAVDVGDREGDTCHDQSSTSAQTVNFTNATKWWQAEGIFKISFLSNLQQCLDHQ